VNGWLKPLAGAVLPVALGLSLWLVHEKTGGWSTSCIRVRDAGDLPRLPCGRARRYPRAIAPSAALVLASAVVFSFERVVAGRAHFEPIIGILPVALAALVCWPLVFFLRLEPAGERQLGRLALLAEPR